MNFKKVSCIGSLCLTILITSSVVFAQETPLTLIEVMTALQSKSSGLSLEQKNTFIANRVEQRGVSFSSSTVIVSELRRAGASENLLSAVRRNGPAQNQTSTTSTQTNKEPGASLKRMWIDKNVVKDGRQGIVVHAHFSAYNLKGKPLQMTVRFQDNNDRFVTTTSTPYANKKSHLALFKNLKPGYDAAEYSDWSVFLPYSELPLAAGTHNLKIRADLIYPNGTLVKNLSTISERVTKPRPSLRQPKAEFDKMWVEYGVRENGLLGMRIHVKMKVSNLKDVKTYLRIGFEKNDGTPLKSKNTLYSDRSGRVTLYSELTPGFTTAVYRDIAIFMPYDEFNLGAGQYQLRMHADLTYPDGGKITHLNYYRFRYREGAK